MHIEIDLSNADPAEAKQMVEYLVLAVMRKKQNCQRDLSQAQGWNDQKGIERAKNAALVCEEALRGLWQAQIKNPRFEQEKA